MPENLYRRGKIWWVRAQHKGTEHRQSLGTASRDLAQERARKWIDRLKSAEWGENGAPSFEDAGEHFVESRLPQIKPRAAERYLTSLRKLTPHFIELRLDEITRAKLAEFVSLRKREGVSHATIIRDLSCLSALWEEAALEWDFEVANPVARFLKMAKRRDVLKEAEPGTRYLSHEEEEALISAAEAPGLSDQIAFAIDTGLRREEQFSLTWRDVDLRSGFVVVKAEVAKATKSRRVPLLPRSAQILAQQPRRIRRAGASDWVFCKPDGSRYMSGREDAFKALVRRTGVSPVNWHDLRRTCGCRLRQDHGMDFGQIREWLGHASVAITERAYAFLEVEQLQEAVGTRHKKRHTPNGH